MQTFILKHTKFQLQLSVNWQKNMIWWYSSREKGALNYSTRQITPHERDAKERDREKSACLIRRPNHSLIAVPVSGITMKTTVIDNEQCWNIHAPKTPTIIIINNRETYLLSTLVWASARSRLLPPRCSTIVGHVLIFFVDFSLVGFYRPLP